MTYVLLTIAWLWGFWAVYVLVMSVYCAHLTKRLTGINRWLGLPVVVVGYVMDVISNLTIATVIFVDLPHEWLVTARLQRYISEDNGWRSKLARAICDHLLDPTENRC